MGGSIGEVVVWGGSGGVGGWVGQVGGGGGVLVRGERTGAEPRRKLLRSVFILKSSLLQETKQTPTCALLSAQAS